MNRNRLALDARLEAAVQDVQRDDQRDRIVAVLQAAEIDPTTEWVGATESWYRELAASIQAVLDARP